MRPPHVNGFFPGRQGRGVISITVTSGPSASGKARKPGLSRPGTAPLDTQPALRVRGKPLEIGRKPQYRCEMLAKPEQSPDVIPDKVPPDGFVWRWRPGRWQYSYQDKATRERIRHERRKRRSLPVLRNLGPVFPQACRLLFPFPYVVKMVRDLLRGEERGASEASIRKWMNGGIDAKGWAKDVIAGELEARGEMMQLAARRLRAELEEQAKHPAKRRRKAPDASRGELNRETLARLGATREAAENAGTPSVKPVPPRSVHLDSELSGQAYVGGAGARRLALALGKEYREG